MTTRLGILLSGRGSNFLALHRAIGTGEVPAEIALVLSNVAEVPGLAKARELGLPTEAVPQGDFPDRDRHEQAVLAKTAPGSLPKLPADASPPDSPRGKLIDAPGVAIAVMRDGKVLIPGQKLSIAEGRQLIEEQYRRALEAAGLGRGPAHPWPLYIWADRDAPAASVADLLIGASDRWSFRLLVKGEGPAPAIDADLLARPAVKKVAAATPPAEPEATEVLARHLRDAAEPCGAVSIAIAASLTEGGPTTERALLAGKIPKAVVSCGCELTDLDVFEYTMLALSGALDKPLKWIDMPKIPRGEKRKLQALVAK